MRALAVSLIGMLVVANAVSLVELVRNIFVEVSGITRSVCFSLALCCGRQYRNLCLSVLELDGDGPDMRADGYRDFPDLVFPQQQADQQGLAPANWKPTFPDYVYVSLTAADRVLADRRDAIFEAVKLVYGCRKHYVLGNRCNDRSPSHQYCPRVESWFQVSRHSGRASDECVRSTLQP